MNSDKKLWQFIIAIVIAIVVISGFLRVLPKQRSGSDSTFTDMVFQLKKVAFAQADEVKRLRVSTAILKNSVDSCVDALSDLNHYDETHPRNDGSHLKQFGFSPIFSGEPSDEIVSKMVTERGFESKWYSEAATKLHFPENIRHRKQWELAYIYYILNYFNLTRDGKRGAALGDFKDSLAPYLVSTSVYLTLVEDVVSHEAWVKDTVSQKILKLKPPWFKIDDAKFVGLIDWKSTDLKNLPRYLLSRRFDFVWSVSTVERLQTLENSEMFLKNCMNMIHPGGIGVFGLELQLDSLEIRIDGDSILWRVKDVQRIRNELCSLGYDVKKLDFSMGSGYYDLNPDRPPYQHMGPNHVKLSLGGHIVTTFLLVVQVPVNYDPQVPFTCE